VSLLEPLKIDEPDARARQSGEWPTQACQSQEQ